MMRIFVAGAALSGMLATAAVAQGMGPGPMPPPHAGAQMTGSQFITAASQSDEFERQEGKMAETMGVSPAVRRFGARMVAAHTRTTMDLHAAIRQAGMAVPPPPPLRPDQLRMIDQLRGMSGPQFDRAYIDQQIQAHEQALSAMSAYAGTGEVPALRAAARMTEPLVASHLQMAKALQAKMG